MYFQEVFSRLGTLWNIDFLEANYPLFRRAFVFFFENNINNTKIKYWTYWGFILQSVMIEIEEPLSQNRSQDCYHVYNGKYNKSSCS